MPEMIDLGMTFDPNEVEEVGGYSLLAPGVYDVTVMKADVTEKNNNKMLALEFQTKAGEIIVGRYNYVHSNETAQKIARSDLKKIFEATGTGATSNVGVLIGKRLSIRVTQAMGKPYTNREGVAQPARMQNEIKGYFKLGSAPDAQASTEAEPLATLAQSAQDSPAQASPAQVKKNPFAK